MKISELVFNDKNIEHIARHLVTPAEVKEIIEANPVILSAKTGRIMALGQTKSGRTLAVILDQVGTGKYFVVTARSADKKEKKMYKEMISGGEMSK